jgi:hypothetical protein
MSQRFDLAADLWDRDIGWDALQQDIRGLLD